MRDLLRAGAGTAVVATLIVGGYVCWLLRLDCCPHELGDDE